MFINLSIVESNLADVTKRSAGSAELDDDGQGSSKKPQINSQYDIDPNNFNKKLPYEVVSHIFGFLPFKDLLNASLVCKKWDDHIGNSFKFMNKILFKVPKQNRHYSPSKPLNRRYVNFELRKLPTDKMILAKFTQIRLQVSSIRVSVSWHYSGWAGLASQPGFCQPAYQLLTISKSTQI